MAKIKELQIQTPQGEAGRLAKESRFSFRYTSSEANRELSLTMPIRAEDYASTSLHPVFESLRPEGFLLERLTKRLLKFGQVDDMQLLAAVGNNGIGRIKFTANEVVSATPVVAPSLREILSSGMCEGLFEQLVDAYLGSGISGVQPKILVPERQLGAIIQPSVIVKATPVEYPFLARNEFVCMTAAKQAGLNVPPGFSLSDDGALIVIDRFDVVHRDGQAYQQGFEDLCQLMGKTSMGKYEGSYENIVRALHMYCKENAALAKSEFFGYLVANCLMRNGDAHLKNFGLLYEHPRASSPVIAPLYDVTTTSAYSIGQSGIMDRTMALKLNGTKDYPSLEALVRFGREKCNVSDPRQVITAVAESMMNVASEYHDLFDHGFGARLFEQWSQSLKGYGFNWTHSQGTRPEPAYAPEQDI